MAAAKKASSNQDSAPSKKEYDFSYTQNRELSWLGFDNRVLDEACDPKVPLLERFSMAAIFESNLDEFMMVRVGSLNDLAALKHEPIDNKSNETPSQQVAAIYKALPPLIKRHDEVVVALDEELSEVGVTRVSWDKYTPEQQSIVDKFFTNTILPEASPQIIGSRHPFPNLRNEDLYCIFNLSSSTEVDTLGVIEVPMGLPRIIELNKTPDSIYYTLLEDVILACAPTLFGDYITSERAVIRVTRNAEIDPDEGSFDLEEDYRQHMKKILKKRLHLDPIRLEVQGKFSKSLVKRMRKALELTEPQVFYVKAPLNMKGYVYDLEDMISPTVVEDLIYPPFSPQASPLVDPDRPMYEQIEDHDILLSYPYESIEPFLRLVHEAAQDPATTQIKITLYRVAKKSRLCESLIAAAENGVDVTVLMELRARFDEQNNIEWAERLEDAGCTVLYGSAGFKVHSKVSQITRRVDGKVVRITQLGTGNYNEKTAGLYCDYSYMTADPRLGEDTNRFFRNMQIGNLQGNYSYLGVAPVGLKPLILRGINREISKARAGEDAYILLKMNSLTDREIIDKISEASCAGVKVDLIIRGISCLLPGVHGKTENVTVRSIVGRMLEHARVYSFGTEFDTIYLSSADMMTRNTEHRVEILYPVLDPASRERIIDDMKLQLSDNVKARILQPDGSFERVPVKMGDVLIDSQLVCMDRAIRAANELDNRLAREENRARRHPIPKVAENEEIPLEVVGEEEEIESEIIEESPVASPAATTSSEPEAEPEKISTPEPEAEPEKISTPEPEAEPEKIPEPEAEPEKIPEPEAEAVRKIAAESTPSNEVISESVTVEATTIPSPDEKEEPEEAAPIDLNQALAIMVKQKGHASTGWALIKAGFSILFGRTPH